MSRRVLWFVLLGALVVGGLSPVAAVPAATGTLVSSHASVLPGESFELSGELRSADAETLELQRFEGSSWTTVDDTTSDREFSFSTSATTRSAYRVARTTSTFAVTNVVWVRAGQSTVVSAPATGRAGSALKISGYTTPAREGRAVALQVARSGAVDFSSVNTARADDRGRVTFTWTPSAADTYRVRLRAAAYRGAPVSVSSASSVEVETRAPAITAINQTRGPAAGGQRLAVTGTDLSSARLTFGGETATVVRQSSTAIIATTPAHDPGRVEVVVTTPHGASSPADYTYVRPAITGLDVARGPIAGGQRVVVTGTDLDGPARVLFDGKSAKIVDRAGDTITVLTPAHMTGTVDVVATTANGTSTPPARYSYIRPVVSTLDRAHGPLAGGQRVTLTGTDLDGATKVAFGASEARIEDVTSTSVTVTTPSRPAGVAKVVVTTPLGYSAATPYTYDATTVDTISPDHGGSAGGHLVTLTGTGLATAVDVSFGDKSASITEIADDSITVRAPAHAGGVVDVVVRTLSGSSAPITYWYVSPVISSVDPGMGRVAGGQTVTLHGTDFAGASAVTFDGVEADIVDSDDTTITVTTPPHPRGRAEVVVTATLGTSAAAAFRYVQPSLAGSGPRRGSDDTLFQLWGDDADTISRVSFGGVDGSIIGFWDGTLFVDVPRLDGGPHDVVVTTPAGDLDAGTFTYLDSDFQGLSPDRGPTRGGQRVTLTGLGVNSFTTVTFDGQNADIVDTDDYSVTVEAPAHAAGEVDVVGQTWWGETSRALTYTYVSPDVVVTGLDPDHGPAAGGQSVTVVGEGLDAIGSVTFGGVDASVTDTSPTSITVTTPAHAAGKAEVVLHTDAGRSIAAGPYTFGIPVLDTIAPFYGPGRGGETVTIEGTDLGAATGVTFDGEPATIQSSTETSITVATPPHARGNAAVVVSNQHGDSDPLYYLYLQPSVVPLDVDGLSTEGQNYVEIHGEDLIGVSAVRFGDQEGTIISKDSERLFVRTPAHAKGNVAVTVSAIYGDLDAGRVTFAKAEVTGIDPGHGSTAGGDRVVIHGIDLASTVWVKFGEELAEVTEVDDDSVTVLTPEHSPGSVDVVVQWRGGRTAPIPFRYEAD